MRVHNEEKGVEERTDWHPLYFSVRVPDCKVIQEEHAVEGFGEELYLYLSRQSTSASASPAKNTHQYISAYQYREANIVGRI